MSFYKKKNKQLVNLQLNSDFSLYDNAKKTNIKIIKENVIDKNDPMQIANLLLLSNNNNNNNKSNNNKNNQDVNINDKHLALPLDVWMLVGGFIEVEEIGTFALICRSTALVTRSPSFWAGIYKRCCIDKSNAPDWWKEENLKIIHGLRTQIIKCLFIMNPSLKMKSSKPKIINMKNFYNSKLIRFWYSNESCFWIFYFKFQKYFYNSVVKRSNLLSNHNVFFNNNEGQFVVKVTSKSLIPYIEQTLGLSLSNFSVSTYALKMTFEPPKSPRSLSSSSGVQLIIPINCYPVIYDWWHPLFPG